MELLVGAGQQGPHQADFGWATLSVCFTSSDGPPGPRKVRGRGAQRYGLDGLDSTEVELVENDTCLLLKQVGLWLKSEQVRGEQGYETGFLFETLRTLCPTLPEEEGRELPSFLEFPEIRALVEEHNMELVSLDQGRTGHERRKPTSLVTESAWNGAG